MYYNFNLTQVYLHDFLNVLLDKNPVLFSQLPHEKVSYNGVNAYCYSFETPYNQHLVYVYELESQKDTEELTDIFKQMFAKGLLKKRTEFELAYEIVEHKIYAYDKLKLDTINYFLKFIEKHQPEHLLSTIHEYHNFCKNISSEFKHIQKALPDIQTHLLHYLHQNESIKTISKDTDETDKEDNIEAFNDSDICPFLFNNYYIIENYAANSISICRFKDALNFDWYYIEDRHDFIAADNDADNDFDDNSYLLRHIEQNLTPINHCLSMTDGIIDVYTYYVKYIFNHQFYIHEELKDIGKIDYHLPEMAFKDLLAYSTEQEIYHLEERAFFELFSLLKYHHDTLTYQRFIPLDDSIFSPAKHENEKDIIAVASRMAQKLPKIELYQKDYQDILVYCESVYSRYPKIENELREIYSKALENITIIKKNNRLTF